MAKNGTAGQSYSPSATGASFGNKLTSYLTADAPAVQRNLYTGIGANTKKGLGMLGTAADGSAPAFKDAFDYTAGVARGDFIGNRDPKFMELLDRTAAETTADINAAVGSSGRGGSNLLADAITDSVGGMRLGAEVDNLRYEQGRQAQAAGALGGLYENLLRPGETYRDIGGVQDADKQSVMLGAADKFNRTKNANYDRFLELLSAFSGSAGAPGMGEKPSFLEQILALGSQAAGSAIGAYAR